MIEHRTPRGLPVFVPETTDEDPSPRFVLTQKAEMLRYYEEHGYAVISGLVDNDKCNVIRGLWEQNVKPSHDFIYRQATAKAERHVFNSNGWVMNPILNLQSLDQKKFGIFREYAVSKVLTDSGLVSCLSSVLGDNPKIVQSMYFEGNSATWEHQDTYYLDSEKIGSMVAAWIALEDISANAGRFFVCAGSHLIDLPRQSYLNNIADHHEEYIQSVVQVIKQRGLEIRAPKLDQGDVLIWNARTIHGSLDSHDTDRSRSSITLHAIPAGHRFLQLQNRIVPLKIKTINGVMIHHPKDLSSPVNRAIFYFETRFPRTFYAIKRVAVRAMVALNSLRH